jgi:RND family efflux transporter MFP subunit
LCVLAIGVAAWLSGCSKSNEKPAVASQSKSEFAVSVKVAPVVRSSIKSTISAVGTVMALNQAKISAKIPGKIEKVLVEEGDRVKAGQTLARMEKTDFVLTKNQAEAAVAMAEANFSKAKTDWARAQELLEKGIASQQQFDLAKSGYDVAAAAVKQAKADLGLAQNQLDNANVTAPFGGTVTQKYCCLGERVAPGQPLLEVADISTVDIEVGVSDKRFSEVELDQPATISVDGYPDRRFTGNVKKIQPSIDPATRTFKVTIGVANPDELLKPGMFARANIEVGFHKGALVIPRAALLEEEGKYLVVVVRNGHVKRMEAIPGFLEADKVEILNGPSEGDQVVIEGAYGLAQDALVKISGE